MKIRDLVEAKEDAIMGSGVSEEEIEAAEKALNLTFAPDYKEYLSTIGLLMCDGHEFTGLGNSTRTNVVAVTQQLKDLRGDIPDDWYVIENENMDGAAMWQDSAGIVYFNKRKEYESFTGYLQDLN